MKWMELVVGILGLIYFLSSAWRLYRGEDAHINGYTSLPREDKQYYDDAKIKKYASYMNLGCAVAMIPLALMSLVETPVLLAVTLVLLVVSLGGFRYLLMRTNFFIRKEKK